MSSTFRRPDFITAQYIAESKNVSGLLYSGREVSQIADYARSAQALNIPLWVYVRVNTTVSAEFDDLVESTGGDVVHYFTVPGYVDPVDEQAQRVLIVAVGYIILMGVWEWRSRRLPVDSRPNPTPEPPSPAAGPQTGDSKDLLKRARRKLDALDAEIDGRSGPT